ncbi:MAG: hypothetical protein Kow00108_12910 [Calditrichia bacterium]
MKYNLLIVDDEKFNLDAINRTLRNNKEYQLYFASNGNEAIEILEKVSPIHIIITDQRMPGMSGIELLQKSLEISPDSIRIILTAYTDIRDMVDAINKGQVYRYLIKPWKPDELKITLKLGLDYYKAMEERKRLVEELKQKSELLEKQNIELRKLAEMKSRFLVVSSHELRTPATIITGSLELLQMHKDNLDENQQKILENAISGAHRLNNILETFFEMVKLDSQTSSFSLKDISFSQLIDNILEGILYAVDERKINIIKKFTDDCLLHVDIKKITLVIENIISNAIKFTPDGGTLTIDWEKTDTQFAKISFKDTGIGIPKEELERIFDTFYQLHNVNYHSSSSYKFMGGGPGLGLSICKNIIEGHGGKIWAESEGQGQGTTFYITLPIKM